MTDALRHRGPDDEGYLVSPRFSQTPFPYAGPDSQLPAPRIETCQKPARLLLGHRRLAVLDLSAQGHQPMGDSSGAAWIVHNGEIYNFVELRKELTARGHTFRTQTDTEVILKAYLEWGPGCVPRLNGMWAFVIYDVRSQTLFGARDRFGVKPFYYFLNNQYFIFASEIKAFWETFRWWIWRFITRP